jgi:HAE1 family hydrophobic/amphiphilic exporter-1
MTPETTFSVEGQGRIMAESMASFATTLLLAVILVWMVLAAQFESYMTPLVIMLSVTLSFVGAILGLLITGREFSMYPMIGILLLVGIVTKNAILLIDFALQRMRAGMPVDSALLEAGPIRLRPILMTTFAMIFGMVPIAIGHGDGGEARAPMAIAVIGGLITSTVLTLVIIPCVFSLFQSVKSRYYKTEPLKHS